MKLSSPLLYRGLYTKLMSNFDNILILIIILILKSDLDVIDVKFDMPYNVRVTTIGIQLTNIGKSFADTSSRVATSLDAGIAVT